MNAKVELPMINNIKVGMRVTIHSHGTSRTGTVISAVDWGYGSHGTPYHDWYVEIENETAYWKQSQDGGDCINAETGEVLVK